MLPLVFGVRCVLRTQKYQKLKTKLTFKSLTAPDLLVQIQIQIRIREYEQSERGQRTRAAHPVAQMLTQSRPKGRVTTEKRPTSGSREPRE